MGLAPTSNIKAVTAKTGSEIKTIQEKMDNGQEEMKAQASSFAPQIDINQE
jgi:hypothetical protein